MNTHVEVELDHLNGMMVAYSGTKVAVLWACNSLWSPGQIPITCRLNDNESKYVTGRNLRETFTGTLNIYKDFFEATILILQRCKQGCSSLNMVELAYGCSVKSELRETRNIEDIVG